MDKKLNISQQSACAVKAIVSLQDIYREHSLELLSLSAVLFAYSWDRWDNSWLGHETEVVQVIIASPGKTCTFIHIGQLKGVFW